MTVERLIDVELLRINIGLIAEVRLRSVRAGAGNGNVEMNVIVVTSGTNDA